MAKHDLPVHHALAANIRRLAQAKGITLTQLPFEAGLSPTHFWKVLRRDAEPRLTWMAKIADALGVPVHSLLEPKDDAPDA